MSDVEADVAPPTEEVLMVEAEAVREIRALAALGWGSKRIAKAVGVARNTVRRYLRGGPAAEVQTRPAAQRVDRTLAAELFEGPAAGNAVVAQRLLAERGVEASVRAVQRAVAPVRRQRLASQLASVRFETAPGHQLQVDFGQKLVAIGGQLVRVHLLVAVLSYSRRLFVKAFLSERQEDWLEGLAEAFRHFGGVPQVVLGDNARALVEGRDRQAGTVRFTPAYLAFCKDWGVQPRACQPYRARTKGKTEAGVKYVKGNALAGLSFTSFAALEAHLSAWMEAADRRVHGTTHEAPMARYLREEKSALRPLPGRPMPSRQRRLRRKVAHDALVDVDTVRYSVPAGLVRDTVEVQVGEEEVRVFHGGQEVARHRRSFEPHARVVDSRHYSGLFRPGSTPPEETRAPEGRGSPLAALGRSLEDYAAALGGAA